MKETKKELISTIIPSTSESTKSSNPINQLFDKSSNKSNEISASEKHFNIKTKISFNNDDIKSLEYQLIAKGKTISELEISLNLKTEESLVFQQENAHLKLENKKLALSVNSPGKVIIFLSKQIKTQNDTSTQNLIKTTAELKETNDKLLLLITEKQAEICQLKESYEAQVLSLNNTIYSLNAKIRDLSNDLEDVTTQLSEKCQQMNNSEEKRLLLLKYNCLKEEFEQISAKVNVVSINEPSDNQLTINRLEKRNKSLEERLMQLEKEYVAWLSTGKISGTSVDQLEFHVTLINGLRSQLGVCEEEINQLENKIKDRAKSQEKKHKYYKQLEEKYIDTFKQLETINYKYIQSEQYFLKGSSSLNKEIAKLLDNNLEMNNIKEELENKIKGLLKHINQLKNEFKMLQDTMTHLREKDDYDITLIEERYIVLESILQTDKAELIQQNRDLLNKIEEIEINNFKGDNQAFINDQELKLIKEENRLLQFKIKEQEKTISEKEKLYEENGLYQNEVKLLRSDIKELNVQHENIKQELVSKTIQLTNELAESRKRTSLLRSQSHMFTNASVLQTNEMKNKEKNNKEDSQKNVKHNNIDELERELFLLKKQRGQEIKEHKEEIEALEHEAAKTKSELTALSYENEVELLRFKKEVKKLSNLLAQHNIEIKNK